MVRKGILAVFEGSGISETGEVTPTKNGAHACDYGAPFVSKFFLKDYGSGTNQMGGFVGGAPVLQMADSWTWWIL